MLFRCYLSPRLSRTLLSASTARPRPAAAILTSTSTSGRQRSSLFRIYNHRIISPYFRTAFFIYSILQATMSISDAKVIKTEPLVSLPSPPTHCTATPQLLYLADTDSLKPKQFGRSSSSMSKCGINPDVSANKHRTTYTDPNGVSRTWEHAERRTRPKDSDIDGVGIFAVLEKSTGKQLIFGNLCEIYPSECSECWINAFYRP